MSIILQSRIILVRKNTYVTHHQARTTAISHDRIHNSQQLTTTTYTHTRTITISYTQHLPQQTNMMHNHTKLDDKQFQAAIQGGAEGQNTDGINENQHLSPAAAPTDDIVEVPPNPEDAGPTAQNEESATAYINADVDMNTQIEPDSNTDNIDPITSLAAETEAVTGLDYMNNPDCLLPSHQTIAERKQEILGREGEASEEEDKFAAPVDSVGNPRPWRALTIKQIREELTATTAPANASLTYSSELGLSRVETVKQQIAYRGVTLQENNVNEAESVEDGRYVYATDNVLGLSRSETVKQQSAYRAATLQENDGNEAVSVEDGPYVYATDNVLGLSRVETVKQQSAYRAATMQQNNALLSSREQFGRVPAPQMNANDNSGAVNSDLIARPGVALYVTNNNNEVSSNLNCFYALVLYDVLFFFNWFLIFHLL